VPNADKILSLYESEVEVLKRGKAGADVEFGNKLWLPKRAPGSSSTLRCWRKRRRTRPRCFPPWSACASR